MSSGARREALRTPVFWLIASTFAWPRSASPASIPVFSYVTDQASTLVAASGWHHRGHAVQHADSLGHTRGTAWITASFNMAKCALQRRRPLLRSRSPGCAALCRVFYLRHRHGRHSDLKRKTIWADFFRPHLRWENPRQWLAGDQRVSAGGPPFSSACSSTTRQSYYLSFSIFVGMLFTSAVARLWPATADKRTETDCVGPLARKSAPRCQ